MALSELEASVRAWAARLGRTFGITREDYVGILELQGRGCPICGKPAPDPADPAGQRRFPVDHDHKTGEVRGIPCEFCNRRRIGQWNSSNVHILRKVLEYVESPPARQYFRGIRVVPSHGKRKRRKPRARVPLR